MDLESVGTKLVEGEQSGSEFKYKVPKAGSETMKLVSVQEKLHGGVSVGGPMSSAGNAIHSFAACRCNMVKVEAGRYFLAGAVLLLGSDSCFNNSWVVLLCWGINLPSLGIINTLHRRQEAKAAYLWLCLPCCISYTMHAKVSAQRKQTSNIHQHCIIFMAIFSNALCNMQTYFDAICQTIIFQHPSFIKIHNFHTFLILFCFHANSQRKKKHLINAGLDSLSPQRQHQEMSANIMMTDKPQDIIYPPDSKCEFFPHKKKKNWTVNICHLNRWITPLSGACCALVHLNFLFFFFPLRAKHIYEAQS